MLVLSRKLNETIVINGNIRLTVVGVRGNQVRLGFEAPTRVAIIREELCLPTPEFPTREETRMPRSLSHAPVGSEL